MLKVQLRFQLLAQQDATKEKIPIGSFGFIFFHSLCPALAAAKSSYKKNTNHVFTWIASKPACFPESGKHRASHKGQSGAHNSRRGHISAAGLT